MPRDIDYRIKSYTEAVLHAAFTAGVIFFGMKAVLVHTEVISH